MPTARDKLAGKTTKLAQSQKKITDHPAAMGNYQEGSFYQVPVAEIKPNPDQPRKYFDQEALEELAHSIKEKGVLQPVIIRRAEDTSIYLVAGERRLRAAKQAGLQQIPAILTKGHPAEIALIENLQRENLKPLEEAEALGRMLTEHHYTQDQLAAVIGKAKSTMSETLSLNKLPEEIKAECRQNEAYPRRVLVEIAKQKNPQAMLALFKQIKSGQLKSDQVRQISRTQSAAKKRTPAAIVLERAAFLRSSLDKLDLDNVAESEKIQLLTELGNLRKLIDHLLK